MTLYRALILTVLAETGAMALFTRAKKALLLCAAVNVFTNIPFNLGLWLLYQNGIAFSYLSLWPAECLIVLVEGLIYKAVLGPRFLKWLGVSLALNAFSYGLGFLLSR